MKHTWKAALAVATIAMIGTAGAAKADLNISGETGLILNPTAEIVKKGHPQVQANYYGFQGDYSEKSYGLYGAIQAADKLEINGGVDTFKSDDPAWDYSGFAIGAKYQLLNQRDKGFDLAVGAGYDKGLQRNEHVYIAATKAFENSGHRAPIKGTVGLRWDSFRLGNDSDRDSKSSVYAGVQLPITRTGEFSLVGEIQSKNVDDGSMPYAIGVRYHPRGQAFSVSAGIQRQGIDSGYGQDSRLFVQAGYTFGR